MVSSFRFAAAVLLLALAASPAAAQSYVPDSLGAGDAYHLVFATRIETGIDQLTFIPPINFPAFGGLDAADWIVTNAAVSAGLFSGWNGLEPVYTALLSSSTTNAVDRLAINAPIYNTAGELLATGESDFFDGALQHPVGFDEFGELVTGEVWTGTNNVGSMTSNTCGDWVNNSGGVLGTIGLAESSATPFSGGGVRPCNLSARLYGVSPLSIVPIRADVNGDGVVDAADYTLWRDSAGQSGAGLAADANDDEAVDATDYQVWTLDYGADSLGSQVPEPSGAALVALLSAGVMVVRSRR